MVTDPDEIFTVKARLCKRCGRLLASKQAIDDGYGCTCKQKARIEKYGQPQLEGQISLLDDEEVET